MDLYTLKNTFVPKAVVDDYNSAIWTERYYRSGDCQIVLPASSKNITDLKEGTYLALRGSKEVMEIQTTSIEDKLLTVVGKTLDEGILNRRFAWFRNPSSAGGFQERVADYVANTYKPGEFIAHIVDLIAINPVPFEDAWEPANLDWELEIIPHLEISDIDTSGEAQALTMPIGFLYDGIQQIAEKYGVGISLYLESASDEDGFELRFKTYHGVDHSTGGPGELVRLTPDLDSLSGLKEIRSIAAWKNVAYVYYAGEMSIHYEDPDDPPAGLERRVLVTDAENQPVGHKIVYTGGTTYYQNGTSGPSYYVQVTPEDIAAFREQNARDALANFNYIQAIDGQTSPAADYQFGVDYSLGDIIELEGITGNLSKARVTEYIRSQDKSGAKEYPTISVLQPGEGG